MLSYQDIVNQDLTERSMARLDWENAEELDQLIQEKYTSYQTNFSRNLFMPDLLYNSDRFANCAETEPKSGVFYDPNVNQSEDNSCKSNNDSVKIEECIDLERLLYNSDEQNVHVIKTEDEIDIFKSFDNRTDKGANNNNYPLVYNKSNNISKHNEYLKYSNNDVRSGCQSACTSASQSPTNVFNMDGIEDNPQRDYYLCSATEVTAESTVDGNFFSDALYDTNMLGDDKLFYTPDNSCGPLLDFAEIKSSKKQPSLTLNLKNTFVIDEEINTPNIIESIMEVSEPLQFTLKKEDIFNEVSFSTSIEELTPCPSTSSPVAVSDNDNFLPIAATEVFQPVKKPGRPRKRLYDSDNESFDNEDDDETYVPPPRLRRKSRESRAVAKKKIIYHDVSDDEDYRPSEEGTGEDDAEDRLKASHSFEEEVFRVCRRGRPPKHARSISSDDYSLLDPEEAKYREMRDRNNEASRKSRYKRKQKEMKMSDELEHLEMENVKLKAQVEELQKTVERYRDNLMKVMLNKK